MYERLLALFILAAAAPAAAQGGTQVGGTANSAVGQIGQRQSADQAKSQTPTGRIASRVQSRVQSRLRNRIDRDYDPQGLWASPFAVAQERARAPARRRR